jgi:hypothetical protein
MGIDPLLIAPENGNYQVAENSPAIGYGCQTFNEKKKNKTEKPNSNIVNCLKNRSTLEFSGEITSDTFWNADTVLVVGNISLVNNATLTIAAGTQIFFAEYYVIHIIEGNITAIGNGNERIVFSSSHPELYTFDDSSHGAWQGIFFDNVSENCDESRFEFCIFEYSKAVSENRVQGGAVHIDGTNKIVIENCIFRKNVAFYGGAIAISHFANPVIMSSLFYQNYELYKGSALFISNAYPKVINNTIVDNHSLNSDFFDETATVFTFFSKPKFVNNIIRNNTTNYFELLQVRESKYFYTHHNNIEQWIDGYGNINLAAEFTNFSESDFSLLPNSPCIDSGFQVENFNFPEFDLAGNPRILGSSIDMGAYEYDLNSTTSGQIVPVSTIIMQVYPNPFNASASINFELQKTSQVELEIFNSKGQKVKKLLNEVLERGEHTIFWNGKNNKDKEVASGVYYFCLFQDGNPISYQKGMLIK